jgi:aryl-alcohol dehydrogenase-like predicted oxidoreductase/predicted MFS family arabinose efflux permease
MSALGRRGGFVAAAYALSVTMLGTTLPTPLYPLYRSVLGFSELMVTVVFASYAVGAVGALLLAGSLSDEIGRRRVLLFGLALSALSAAAFLLAQGVGLLLVGRVLSGLSAGVFTGTATATLVDLAAPEGRARATLVATVANMGALGCGPLLAGLLAQFGPMPLRLAFWVDLALLVPVAALVWVMPEPIGTRGAFRVRLSRLRIPSEVRAAFVPAAFAAFVGFAVLGLFTAVAPGFLGQILGIDNRAIVGLVVFAVFAASIVGQTLLVRAFGARALVAGFVGLIAGMGLLALGLAVSSLPLLVAGGIVAGLGQGSSFRHGLAAINEASPPQRRGEVASGFFVIAYLGIALPVVGVGLVTDVAGLRAAGLLFAAVVAALSAIVLAVLVRDRRRALSVRRPTVSTTAYGTKGDAMQERAQLETVELGSTGLEITRVGFGAWAIGGGGWAFGWGPREDEESIAAIHRALVLGINWIDTTAAYGFGHSEEVVGRAIAGLAERPYVFTKASLVEGTRRSMVHNLKRDSILREVGDSLERLGVDAIDLYQIHWPIPEQDLEEGWSAFAELKEQGLVRHIGVSNFDVAQLERIRQIAPVETLQPPYSLVDRDIEQEILPYAERQGIGVIVYSPMGSGLLTGRMSQERIDRLPADELAAVAARYGKTPGAVAVAWTLRNPAVDGAIVGFRRPDQVDPIVAAAGLQLTAADAVQIEGAQGRRVA